MGTRPGVHGPHVFVDTRDRRMPVNPAQLLGELRRENPSLASRVNGLSGQYARSAPGTEGFKQDFTRWDELRQDVAEALERLEVGRSGLLSAEKLRGRLSSGADESVPETYRALVEAYYEALAVAERRR